MTTATFCLRLAWGMIASVLIVPMGDVPPRFVRVQFLSSLGLLAVAGFFLPDESDVWQCLALGTSLALCFAGSVLWHLDGAPGGKIISLLATGAVTWVLIQASFWPGESLAWSLADNLSAACFLGAATAAMLMGHSYLIAPAMSMTPLYRLLGATGVGLAARIGVALAGLWLWTRQAGGVNLESDMLVWLPTRWILGILFPLGLAWMAWETAKIRSTQSATGILYVLVIFTFLGELTSLVLVAKTGMVL